MDERVIKSINEARWADGQIVRNRLEDITFNPMQSQEEFVMRLVRENAKTAFGQEHGFKNIRSVDEYRQRIQLSTYSDYTEYFERIANIKNFYKKKKGGKDSNPTFFNIMNETQENSKGKMFVNLILNILKDDFFYF